jgi:hypothetical protein
MSDAGPMDWHLTLVVGLLTGFIAGFASGYGTRAFIPHSPDDALNFRRGFDSDIAISSLSWIERGGRGEPNG